MVGLGQDLGEVLVQAEASQLEPELGVRTDLPGGEGDFDLSVQGLIGEVFRLGERDVHRGVHDGVARDARLQKGEEPEEGKQG